MIDDAELTQRFVAAGDESAFAIIVERHKGLVYGSALRQTNNVGLAEEITQAVFIVLARKASTLKPGTLLSGWLFRTTRFIACDALKAEQRRRKREQVSSAMNLATNEGAASQDDGIWQEIAPGLDEALAQLGEKDRNALLLRFFAQKNLTEVGQALGIGEDGARKRVERALNKLRGLLAHRGVAIPAAVLSTVLFAKAVPPVPASVAVGTTLDVSPATTSLVKGALACMAWSKTKMAAVTIGSLLLLNSGALVVVLMVQHQQTGAVRTPVTAPSSQDELVLTTFSPSKPDNEGFISLFNGRDLSGWNYNPQIWSVNNGVIVGRAPIDSPTTVHYMAWAGGEVDDFELRLKVRTTADDNSGVPLRARWSAQRWFPGYQVEIHGQRSGLLVIAGNGRERQLARAGWRTTASEENGRDILASAEPLPDLEKIEAARAAIENGEWCEVSISAQGPRITVQLNGTTVIDARDEHPTKAVSAGMLGLEYSHRRESPDAVEFKDIRFKRFVATP